MARAALLRCVARHSPSEPPSWSPTGTVALVAESGLPDGVAASPVLAGSYRAGLLVPMLVVGDSLPGSARDYLAATPQEDAAGNKLHMEIVAIGGTAAVTRAP